MSTAGNGRGLIIVALAAASLGFGAGTWFRADDAPKTGEGFRLPPLARDPAGETWLAAAPVEAATVPVETEPTSSLAAPAVPPPARLPVPAPIPDVGRAPASSAAAPSREVAALTPASPSAAVSAEPALAEDVTRHAIEVRSGDTLTDVLARVGVEGEEAHAVATALGGVYDPRRLQAGQALLIDTEPDDDGAGRLAGLRFNTAFDTGIRLTRLDDGYAAETVARPTVRRPVHSRGAIDGSLFLAAQDAGVPDATLLDFIRLFSWDVDFQRDVQAGDGFEMVYDSVTSDDGAETRGGDVLYARLGLGDRAIETFRFTTPGGAPDYYDRRGKALKKFLMRTPIEGARLSSVFGPRKHPILGYTRMHKGTDFAAPTGTPIFAAGAGKVTFVGRKGAYGNYVAVRHNGEYATAYAHMHGFAEGLAAGDRVEQAQVIGYVGTTGRSTGPHLHYEVHHHGEAVNPLGIRPATVATVNLTGDDLRRFRREVARIDRLRRGDTGAAIASNAAGAPRVAEADRL